MPISIVSNKTSGASVLQDRDHRVLALGADAIAASVTVGGCFIISIISAVLGSQAEGITPPKRA